MKASGLSDADGVKRLLPSLTTVPGLVRHLTDVERFWFRDRIDGQQDVPTRWSAEDPDGEFRVSDEDSLAGIIADYEAACRESREVLEGYGVDEPCRGGDGGHSVRWVLVHMIEETGRHCGHLDILRAAGRIHRRLGKEDPDPPLQPTRVASSCAARTARGSLPATPGILARSRRPIPERSSGPARQVRGPVLACGRVTTAGRAIGSPTAQASEVTRRAARPSNIRPNPPMSP
ncbi:DinB family protein [Arthrobacter sp. TMS2-4]